MPAKFLSSPGVGTPKNISFHKIPARYHLLCLKYGILNFQNCRLVRDIKMTPRKAVKAVSTFITIFGSLSS